MNGKQEILGTNIIAVQTKLLNPKMILNAITKTHPEYTYENVQPDRWYPAEQFTLLTDEVEEKLSKFVLLKIGRGIIPEMLKIGAIPKLTPEQFLLGLSDVYHSANRGSNIGDWKVIETGQNHIILENSTFHNCYLEEGVLLGGIEAFGGKFPKITQRSCLKNGDSICTFDITWS